MNNTDVKISVIIPNLHSPMVDKTIESVLGQETDIPFEIIVVGMDKWGLLENFSDIVFIETQHPVGASEARNIGIQQSHGEWLLFIDSDCIAHKNWMNVMEEAFSEGWQVIGGGVTTPTEPFLVLVYNLSMFHRQLASQKRGLTPFLPTLNLAVHREVINNVGLMDENLPRGQDVDWTSRMTLAGYELLFEPLAKIQHIPSRSNFKTIQSFFHKSGFYMIDVRYRYPQIFKMSEIYKNPLIFTIFAPLIAALTTLKILVASKEVRQNINVIPYTYLLKLSWCYGAASGLKAIKDNATKL